VAAISGSLPSTAAQQLHCYTWPLLVSHGAGMKTASFLHGSSNTRFPGGLAAIVLESGWRGQPLLKGRQLPQSLESWRRRESVKLLFEQAGKVDAGIITVLRCDDLHAYR